MIDSNSGRFLYSKEFQTGAPSIAPSCGHQLLKTNKRADLLGHPPPRVQWLKNGSEIDQSETGIEILSDTLTHSLTKNSVTKSDAGKYSIFARNSLGRQQCHVVVSVDGDRGDADSVSNTSIAMANGSKRSGRESLPSTPAMPSLTFEKKESVSRKSTNQRSSRDEPRNEPQKVPEKVPERIPKIEPELEKSPEPVIEPPKQVYSTPEVRKEPTPEPEVASKQPLETEVEPELKLSAQNGEHDESHDEDIPAIPPPIELETTVDEPAPEPEQTSPSNETGPKLIKGLNDQDGENGAYLVLEVEFDSCEKVDWTLNGVDLPSSIVVRPTPNGSKIRIRNLTENEVGTYYATGWSKSGGSTSSTGMIKLTSSPMQSPRSPAKPVNQKAEKRKESVRDQSELRTGEKEVIETKVEKTKEGTFDKIKYLSLDNAEFAFQRRE